MSYAAQLRAVRACYGFSQPALAPWLGLGRAQVASVETGREPLPAHARPWLRPWVQALAEAESDALPTPASTAAPAATGPAPVLARVAECHYQAQRLGQQLAALQAAHRTAARRLAAGPLLLAALPAPAADEAPALALRRRWLARLLEEAADALAPEAPGGPVAARLLEARRRGYLHEAAWLLAGL
ncbi:hypothetical protein GCM10022409_14880 [Hymenobacter glaciei]|uniref:HTH cro/C1-type domain-containing protein n=1 Tax=Hymenobacter glaciei TaxID=877209 RepID=A0ABP7TVK7_9BACT